MFQQPELQRKINLIFYFLDLHANNVCYSIVSMVSSAQLISEILVSKFRRRLRLLFFFKQKSSFRFLLSSCLYEKLKIYNLLIETDNRNILKKLFSNHALMKKKVLPGNKIRFVTNSLSEAILGRTI